VLSPTVSGATTIDAPRRLRKYLARFGLDWRDLAPRA